MPSPLKEYRKDEVYRRSIDRNARRKMRGFPRVCFTCGYDKFVEVCHIKPVSEFPPSAFVSEINSLDNLILLCRNCHYEYDNGLLTI